MPVSSTTSNPFHPTVADLPAVLPIFPLPGAMLLPHQQLPLNIFEPRYLDMIFAALRADRNIGMIQPEPDTSANTPTGLSTVGCAGRITSFSETDDGRLLLNLTGVSRFEVLEELAQEDEFRRVRPSWARFSRDLSEPQEPDIELSSFERTLKAYFMSRGLEVKWSALESLPRAQMVDFLSMHMPFSPSEKQALLECGDHARRAALLVAFAEVGLAGAEGQSPTRH